MKIDSLQEVNLQLGNFRVMQQHSLYCHNSTVELSFEDTSTTGSLAKQFQLINFDLFRLW